MSMPPKDESRTRELQLREVRKKIDAGWRSLQRGERIDGGQFFKDLERDERRISRRRKRGD